MKHLNNRTFLLSILILLSTSIIWSEQHIGEIKITGLKRTNQSVVMDLLNIKEGDSLDKFNEEEFKQEVLKTGIFSGSEISYRENEDMVNISIDIKEKWTLIPLPIVSVDSEQSTFGVAAFDTNFLGMKKVASLVGIYSTENKFFLSASYMDDKLINKNTGMVLSVGSGNQTSMSPNFNSSISITNSSIKDVNFSGTIAYLHMEKESLLDETTSTFDYISPGIRASVSKQKYSNTISTGWFTSVRFVTPVNLKSPTYVPNLTINAQYNANPISRLFVGVNFKGDFFEKPDELESPYGSKTLLSVESMDQHITGALNIEFIMFDLSWGAISSAVFFEAGVYDTNRINPQRFYGPGFELSIYLKGISVPAFGIGLGYNIESGDFNPSLNFGISM